MKASELIKEVEDLRAQIYDIKAEMALSKHNEKSEHPDRIPVSQKAYDRMCDIVQRSDVRLEEAFYVERYPNRAPSSVPGRIW